MTSSISLLTAFAAGLASFASPCVLPIVPGYLSFISGVNVAQLKGEAAPTHLMRRIGIMSIVFVLGFSTVFISLGAAATMLGYYLQQYKRELAVVGGAIVVVLGLHTAGIVKIPWLLYERRAEMRARPLGLPGAYLVGLAFGFGWTPCIGPILGGILVYASQQETITQGVVLLSFYSAGLGIPFIVSGLAVNRFFKASGALKRHMHAVEVGSGLLLVAVGVLLMSNRLELLARSFSKMFPALTRIG
ncbi:MAG TPA: cytochrome c biogenesis protein CcdA [Vicinamibacteria bacterium]|jgi:cytochrome c-type biogenesis protein|nr:cytochrome c biogenesis protein CcdA [Vicinamibacteria bacterium]